jgi:hypothetical protein
VVSGKDQSDVLELASPLPLHAANSLSVKELFIGNVVQKLVKVETFFLHMACSSSVIVGGSVGKEIQIPLI